MAVVDLFLRLNQLDSIAERIAKIQAALARNWNGIQNLHARLLKMVLPLDEVFHFISDVSLGGRAVDVFFDADVELMLPGREPDSTATLQRRRLGNLFQPQHIAIKRPRRLQIGGGDGDLRVMNSENRR